MNNKAFQDLIKKLYASLAEIAQNVDYILINLPSLTILHTERLNIERTCEEFKSAVYDVRKEIRNLEDKLGLHPDEDPFDPGINNPDPYVTMNFIDKWLCTRIYTMHQTVQHLEKLSMDTGASNSAYVLVAESAVNILNAYSAIKESLGSIGAELDRKGHDLPFRD